MNKKLKPTLTILLCLAAILCSTLLSGCDEDLLIDLAVDWSIDNGIYDGGENINYVNLGREMTDDAIDSFFGDETQAQLESGEVVNDVRNADELANAGALSGDVTLIDDAIKLRPNDWSYTEKRSAVLLAQGETGLWSQSKTNSTTLVQNSIANGNDCVTAYRNLYQQRVAALEQQLEYYPNNSGLINDLGFAKEGLEHPEYDCE